MKWCWRVLVRSLGMTWGMFVVAPTSEAARAVAAEIKPDGQIGDASKLHLATAHWGEAYRSQQLAVALDIERARR